MVKNPPANAGDMGLVPELGYHLGRACGRCQELAGIRVQSGSHRRDSHLGKVCEPTDSCLARLGSAWLGSFPAEMSGKWVAG